VLLHRRGRGPDLFLPKWPWSKHGPLVSVPVSGASRYQDLTYRIKNKRVDADPVRATMMAFGAACKRVGVLPPSDPRSPYHGLAIIARTRDRVAGPGRSQRLLVTKGRG
jgi:hypothetical protein